MKIFLVPAFLAFSLPVLAQDYIPPATPAAIPQETAVSTRAQTSDAQLQATAFIKERGDKYCLSISTVGAWIACGTGSGKPYTLNAVEKENLARFIVSIPAKGEESYMAGALRAKLAAAKITGPAVERSFFTGTQEAPALTAAGRRLVIEIIISPDGPPSPEMQKRIADMTNPGAKHAKEHQQMAFDWDRFARNISDGNFNYEFQFYREKDGAKISRIEVNIHKTIKNELLLPSDITKDSVKDSLDFAGIDAALPDTCGAQLVRAMDTKLYFDVPTEKTAPFAKELISAGFGVKPLILQGEGSYNFPKTGPQ
jgi:hypothetical protein